MTHFKYQSEIFHALLNGSELIVDGNQIFKFIDGDLKTRKITETDWREPVYLHNYLHRTGYWDYYTAERNQEFLNELCEGRWCWVSDDDPNERTTVVRVREYHKPDKFVDADGLTWKFASVTDRWHRVKWGYYSPFEME